MPNWLVKKELTELDRIDKRHESGKINKKEHDRLSKIAVEKALAIEKNITKCKNPEHKAIMGKYR